MRIIAGVLCDYAELREGLLTIVSAGITRLWRAQLPGQLGVFLALQIEVASSERRLPHEFEVVITGPSGKEVGKATGGFQVAGGPDIEVDEPAVASLPLDFRPVPIGEYGWYDLAISIDGDNPHHLRVRVAVPPVAPTTPGIRIAPHSDRKH
jgi:hypothetical protein